MSYSVYVHTNTVNGKRYVGITKQTPEHRWGVDGKNYSQSPYFMSAIIKYGWEKFKHEIIQDGLTQNQACELEIALIREWKLQDTNYGYNILSGGTAPLLPSEVREKISKALEGNKNGLGHPCTAEKKEKIRKAQLGIPLTEEHKKKLSEAAKRRHTKCSEEKKKILSKNYPNKRKVYCLELDKIFQSVQECGKELGIPASNISKLCKGRGKTLKGFHFQYYDTINA